MTSPTRILPGLPGAPDLPGARTTVPARRLDTLTALRFPAALAVFAFHSSLPELPLFADTGASRAYYRIFSQAGGLGVTFFFVLSGFVLTYSARPGDRPRDFWRRRLIKVLPLYYVTCGLALLALHWGDVPWQKVTLYVTTLQVWVPDYPTNFSVLAPGWSLAVEVFFYLAFPVVVVPLLRRGSRTLAVVLAAVVAATAAVVVLAGLLPAGVQRLTNEPTVSGTQYWFDYVFPPARLTDFVLGALLAELLRRGRVPRVPVPLSYAALAVGYAVALVSPVLLAQRLVLLVPCALVIVAAAQRDLDGNRTRPVRRRLVWLGEISFAFYLLHFIVLHVLDVHVLHGPTHAPLAIAAYLVGSVAGTLILAAAAHRWVELPVSRRFGGSTAARPSAQGRLA